jgi:hypothetical protein
MSSGKRKKFAEKHEPGATPDRRIKEEILKQIPNKELSCKVAFEIAKKLQVSKKAVGLTADLLEFKLVKCQLGASLVCLDMVFKKNKCNKKIRQTGFLKSQLTQL